MSGESSHKGKCVEQSEDYKKTLYALHVELVKLQKHLIAHKDKILVIFEGRDGAGKDGTIKRIVEYLSPRETRVVALGKPSDREATEWYFQRYCEHLPAAAEFVLFNRSWYNRAGVEPVMGFCTDAEYQAFMEAVPSFEAMLLRSGIRLLKYYLDITRDEQAARLKSRRSDPLKQWKISPIDEVALKHWKGYTEARNEMFARTHTPLAPWYVVRADDKHQARLHVIKHLLSRLDYGDKDAALAAPDPEWVVTYDEADLRNGWIAS